MTATLGGFVDTHICARCGRQVGWWNTGDDFRDCTWTPLFTQWDQFGGWNVLCEGCVEVAACYGVSATN